MLGFASMLMASSAAVDRLYIEDAFSTYLYTGNGSTQTITNGIPLVGGTVTSRFAAKTYAATGTAQTITTGIDLAGQGGMVWTKSRFGTADHVLLDTVRGGSTALFSDLTSGNYALTTSSISFSSTGHSVTGAGGDLNGNGGSYISWSFRKAAKFFDVITWTGDGTAGRQIAHGLGVTPGMVIVKATSTTGNWMVRHKDQTNCGMLNTTDTFVYTNQITAFSDATFTVGSGGNTNVNGTGYIAYIFADDSASDGVIRCGSYTGNGSTTGPTVNLGWRPQWVLIKNASNVDNNWVIFDTARGIATGFDNVLMANVSTAETASVDYLDLTSTGFQLKSANSNVNSGGTPTYVYMAIREPEPQPGDGGLVWIKGRGATEHDLFDTVRGATKGLFTHLTAAETAIPTALTSFNANGFTLGSYVYANQSTLPFVAWTFRRRPKFFDIVTWTGDGNTSTSPGSVRSISHSLGTQVGFIVIKATSTTGNWMTLHKGSSQQTLGLLLDNTVAAAATIANDDTRVSAADFKPYLVSTQANLSGVSYVAYIWAHDPTPTGLIQCGSFTDATAGTSVNLGWEPQFLLTKCASQTQNWVVHDSMRGFGVSSVSDLYPNLSNAESSLTAYVQPTATGFRTPGAMVANGATMVYMAIRRGPMRQPTAGTSVFMPIAYTGNNSANRSITGTGFPPDLAFYKTRGSGAWVWNDRLRGGSYLLPYGTQTESASTVYGFGTFLQDGARLGTDLSADGGNATSTTYGSWFFRRAPGFFDIATYTSSGSISQVIPHNLGVRPELIITKQRNAAGNWAVAVRVGADSWRTSGATGGLIINATAATVQTTALDTFITDTGFQAGYIGGGYESTSTASATYVAYLFGSVPGVSKIGSLSGSAGNVTVDCGFVPRFVLLKPTSSVGDWIVFDTARGINTGTADPYLKLNATTAEASFDNLDLSASGFTAKQLGAGSTWIYMAIA